MLHDRGFINDTLFVVLSVFTYLQHFDGENLVIHLSARFINICATTLSNFREACVVLFGFSLFDYGVQVFQSFDLLSRSESFDLLEGVQDDASERHVRILFHEGWLEPLIHHCNERLGQVKPLHFAILLVYLDEANDILGLVIPVNERELTLIGLAELYTDKVRNST